MRKNKKGFTLVELLVVIAILAILATVAVVGYTSFIEQANQSVDMQIVKQMNIVLEADEITNGKPSTVVEAKGILLSNRLDDFTPVDEKNVFYWVGTENRVLIWTKDSVDAETGKITFPEDLAKKYGELTEPSADWHDLSLDYTNGNHYIEIAPAEGEEISQLLITNIQNAPDGAVIRLPADQDIDLTGKTVSIGNALKDENGYAKSITIDLNGSKIKTTVPSSINVPSNASLELVNGSADIDTEYITHAALLVKDGGHLVLKNMDIKTDGSAVYPYGTASEVIIENSTIYTTGAFAVATNRAESSSVKITIRNSHIESTYSSAVFINTTAQVEIVDSYLKGIVHGLVVRMGYADVKNSTIEVVDTEPGIYAYDHFSDGEPSWRGGNAVPGAAVVLGDYAAGTSYVGAVKVSFSNVTLKSADADKLPLVLWAARHEGTVIDFKYDDRTNITDIIRYGDAWRDSSTTFTHAGTMTVNGTRQ